MTWLEEERTRRDSLQASFDALRQEVQLGFARIDARFEQQNASFATSLEKQNTAIAIQNGALEKGLKEQTPFFFLAWVVILAAIVGIYARVG